MSDPVADQEYALNAVTLTYHFVGALNMRLAFEAIEYGDEADAGECYADPVLSV
jgi:hypothetical protein